MRPRPKGKSKTYCLRTMTSDYILLRFAVASIFFCAACGKKNEEQVAGAAPPASKSERGGSDDLVAESRRELPNGSLDKLEKDLVNAESPAATVRSFASHVKTYALLDHDEFISYTQGLSVLHGRLIDLGTLDGWASAGHIASSVHTNIGKKAASGVISPEEARKLVAAFQKPYPEPERLDEMLVAFVGEKYRSPQAQGKLEYGDVVRAAVAALGESDPDIYLIAGLDQYPSDPAWYLEAKNPIRCLYPIASSQVREVACSILVEYLARGGKVNVAEGAAPVSKEELTKTVPDLIAKADQETLFATMVFGSAIFNAAAAEGKIHSLLSSPDDE